MKIAIVMPAFNEVDAIPEFLSEIADTFSENAVTVLVVDDCSTDGTREALEALPSKPIVHSNHANMGHGPSYLRALRLACDMEVDFVIATDGDGQVSGKDLLKVLSALTCGGTCAIGLRTDRHEPIYRKLASAASNLLVLFKTGQSFKDSNSPHRAFSREFLSEYIEYFSGEESIPNIMGTVHLLNKTQNVKVVTVKFRDRLGPNKMGTSWGKSRVGKLPSLKFLKFCLKATFELVRI
jgi:glycosyltransferase involved in cell wall biosynthesis